MIIEVDYKPAQLDISYLDANGNKQIMQFPMPNGYSQWTVDATGVGTPGYIDISGKPVVRNWAKSFRTFDWLMFLKQQPQHIQDELFAYREANLVASDIETEIGDRFPKPELAEMPINAISCVDKNMNILIYTTKQCQGEITVTDKIWCNFDHPEAIADEIEMPVSEIVGWAKELTDKMDDRPLQFINEHGQLELVTKEQLLPKFVAFAENCLLAGYQTSDRVTFKTGSWYYNQYRTTTVLDEVNKIINEQIKHLVAPHEKLEAKILQYDTEKQMLEAYLSNIIRFAAVMAFWNGDGFDKPYILNRCYKLGIPVQMGSITGEIASMTNTPKHTAFVDYMFMVDEYDRSIKNKESLKLDYISMRALGVGKLPYRGTLKHLSECDIPGFLAYNAIDSCLVQLLHRQMNLMATLYGFCMVCKMPLVKANSQVAQTESLISLDALDMLDMSGLNVQPKPNTGLFEVAAFNPVKPPRRKYDGGHVKEPFKHVAKWCACVDFSGLYPSVHRSCNFSVENYLGPISQYNNLTQKAILDSPNYFVSVNNKVYRNDKEYAYKRIQVYLRSKRDYHKKRMQYYLSVQQPFIELALHERGVWAEKPVVDESMKELIYEVEIDGKIYKPDLVHLNNPGPNDGYEHDTGFLWFLFHSNLKQGFFEMNMQVSYKLVANSLYGATANEWNSFGNVDVADDTTAEGRNSIKTAQKIINNFFNFELATDTNAHKWLLDAFPGQFTKLTDGPMQPINVRDRVLYIDTDSLYIEYDDILDYLGFTGDKVNFFIFLYDGYSVDANGVHHPDLKHGEKHPGYLGELVNARLHKMVNDRHGNSMQAFDLEFISSDALFRKKKSYLKASTWNDGRRYNYDDSFKHLKTTGFALARTFQSEKCRTVARQAIVEIMQGKWQTKDDYVRNMMTLWQDFQTWSIEDISKRLSIRKDQYESHILSLDPLPEFAKRTLPQYKGAAWHNWHLRQRGLTDQLQDIDDGFICFYEDTFGNHFAYRIFELPEWHPEPNKVIQFYKLLGDIIRDVAMFYGIVAPLPLAPGDAYVPDSDDE